MSRNPRQSDDGDSRYGGNGHANRFDGEEIPRGRREDSNQGDSRGGSQGSRYLPESEQRPGMRRDDWTQPSQSGRRDDDGRGQGSNFDDTDGYRAGGDERYYQSFEIRGGRQMEERGGRSGEFRENRGRDESREYSQDRDPRSQGRAQSEGRYQGSGGGGQNYGTQRNSGQGQGSGQDRFGFGRGQDSSRESGRGEQGGFDRSISGSNGPGASQGFYGSTSGGRQSEGSRTQQEDHSGKGPRGYQRSDDRIKEEVSEALKDHAGIDASDIEVEVSGGMVTLSGGVMDRYAKRIAVEVVEDLRGVKDVHNQLRITNGESKNAQSGNGQAAGQYGQTGTGQAAGQYGQSGSSRTGKESEKGTEKDANKERTSVSR